MVAGVEHDLTGDALADEYQRGDANEGSEDQQCDCFEMRRLAYPAAGVEGVGSGEDLGAGTEQSADLALESWEIGGAMAQPYRDELGAGNVFH